MPRTARAIEAGMIYHVLNRGNGRMKLFHKPSDFDAFEKILAEGLKRYPVELLAWCIMSNHWHLVLRPKTDRAISDLMCWVGVTHVRRYHSHHQTGGGGHIYQGRFKSFPVENADTSSRSAVTWKPTRDGRSWSRAPNDGGGAAWRERPPILFLRQASGPSIVRETGSP